MKVVNGGSEDWESEGSGKGQKIRLYKTRITCLHFDDGAFRKG